MQRSISMDSGITTVHRRRNTKAYSAFYQIKADRARARQKNQNNNDEGVDSIGLKKILRDRISAQTEGAINAKVFFKTLLYEIPPLPIGFALCVLIDGYTAAHNRELAPPTATLTGLFQWIFFTFVISLPYFAVGLAFFLKTPEETEWSLIEPLQLIVYYALWKISLAAKHSVAGCLHAHGLYGLNSPRFDIASRMNRIQFTTWVLGADNQPGAVLEELYTSSLRADCNLNLLEFDVGSEKSARELVQLVKHWKIKVATCLECKHTPIPTWHTAHKDHWNQQFVKRHTNTVHKTSITEENTEEKGPLESTSKYVIGVDSSPTWTPTTVPLPRCPISKYAEDDDFCLFKAFFRDTNDETCEKVENMILKGKIPASYLSLLIGIQNWRYTPIVGVTSLSMLSVLFMVFLPHVCRAIFTDKPAFGETQAARLVLGFTLVGSFLPVMLLFMYNVNCSLEMGFRFKASKFLRDLSLPEGAVVDDGTKNSTQSTRVRLNLSRACNVVSWGAVRELMHGAAFCPFMHSKSNAYVACAFAAAIGVSSIASFGGLILGVEEAGIWVTLPGVVKSLFFSLATTVFVLLAYRVNFSTRYQRLEISKARLVVLAEITELEQEKHLLQLHSKGDEDQTTEKTMLLVATELAELKSASELLQVVDKQTTVSDHANPVRAMGLVADPAVLSIIVSILLATLYVEIQKLSTAIVIGGGSVNLGPIVVPSPSSSIE